MTDDVPAEPVAAKAPTSRVGRLMVLMVVMLSAVFGGIGWLQTQSLTLLNANGHLPGVTTSSGASSS